MFSLPYQPASIGVAGYRSSMMPTVHLARRSISLAPGKEHS